MMKIKLTSAFVADQDKALKFYTEVLGFVKKTEIPMGEAKWLTVVSPEEPDGPELLLGFVLRLLFFSRFEGDVNMSLPGNAGFSRAEAYRTVVSTLLVRAFVGARPSRVCRLKRWFAYKKNAACDR